MNLLEHMFYPYGHPKMGSPRWERWIIFVLSFICLLLVGAIRHSC